MLTVEIEIYSLKKILNLPDFMKKKSLLVSYSVLCSKVQ